MLNAAVRDPVVKPMVRLRALDRVRRAANTARPKSPCSNCCFRGVCLPAGMHCGELSERDKLTTLKRDVAQGTVLYHIGEKFNMLHAVSSGAFKTISALGNGKEKVTGIYLAGEVIGLDAISSARHNSRAVALEDSEVCAIPFAKLEELALRIPELQRELLRMLSGDIARGQGLMLLLGSMTAEQRLAAFLLRLSRRYNRLGHAAVHLCMTREDIGNYLGLAFETVSRLMSRFRRDGLISTQQREIELRDAAALMQIVGH